MYGADAEKAMQAKTLRRMRTMNPAALPSLNGHDPAALAALNDGDVILITNLRFGPNDRGGSMLRTDALLLITVPCGLRAI